MKPENIVVAKFQDGVIVNLKEIFYGIQWRTIKGTKEASAKVWINQEDKVCRGVDYIWGECSVGLSVRLNIPSDGYYRIHGGNECVKEQVNANKWDSCVQLDF